MWSHQISKGARTECQGKCLPQDAYKIHTPGEPKETGVCFIYVAREFSMKIELFSKADT